MNVNNIKPLKLKLLEPVEILLDGELVLINRNNLPVFANHSWFIDRSQKGQTKYLKTNIQYMGEKRTVSYHRLIMGGPVGVEIDHINGNGLDNRVENLRIVNHQINMSNQRKRYKKGSSKFFGVSFCKTRPTRPWCCYVSWNNKTKNVGTFVSEIEAANAYNNYLILHNIPKQHNLIK